jgi:uncharacterized membrane protein YwzB
MLVEEAEIVPHLVRIAVAYPVFSLLIIVVVYPALRSGHTSSFFDDKKAILHMSNFQ